MKTSLEPFLATFSGGKFYPFGPDPDRIKIADIAHALSNICRYNGHTSSFWSVAAHSLEVSRRVEAMAVEDRLAPRIVSKLALAGLLHDASEAYLMDVPKPIKPLFLNYAAWEENLERAIATRFGITFPHPDLVKVVDDCMVPTEVANFFPPGSAAWARYGIRDRGAFSVLVPLQPYEAELRFLDRFGQLMVEA